MSRRVAVRHSLLPTLIAGWLHTSLDHPGFVGTTKNHGPPPADLLLYLRTQHNQPVALPRANQGCINMQIVALSASACRCSWHPANSECAYHRHPPNVARRSKVQLTSVLCSRSVAGLCHRAQLGAIPHPSSRGCVACESRLQREQRETHAL